MLSSDNLNPIVNKLDFFQLHLDKMFFSHVDKVQSNNFHFCFLLLLIRKVNFITVLIVQPQSLIKDFVICLTLSHEDTLVLSVMYY